MRVGLPSLCLGVALLSACEDSIGIDDYCAREAEAVCDYAAGFGCGPVDRAACLTLDEARCSQVLQSPDLVAALDAGIVRWDGVAAAALVAPDGEASSAAIARISKTHSSTWDTYDGALLGTLPVGAACSGTLTDAAIEPCADGMCVGGRCLRAVAYGEPCDATTQCVAGFSTFDTVAPPTAACVAGTCRLQHGWQGAGCATNGECASGSCVGGTCSGLPLGAACVSAEGCGSGVCDGTCMLAPSAASTCARQADCPFYLYCDGTACVPAICADLAP